VGIKIFTDIFMIARHDMVFAFNDKSLGIVFPSPGRMKPLPALP